MGNGFQDTVRLKRVSDHLSVHLQFSWSAIYFAGCDPGRGIRGRLLFLCEMVPAGKVQFLFLKNFLLILTKL